MAKMIKKIREKWYKKIRKKKDPHLDPVKSFVQVQLHVLLVVMQEPTCFNNLMLIVGQI